MDKFEDPVLGYFVTIRDSVFEESSIIDNGDDYVDLIERLDIKIEELNNLRIIDNDRPSTLMEKKHSGNRVYWKMFENIETINDKEIIRYSDGRESYRIEEV